MILSMSREANLFHPRNYTSPLVENIDWRQPSEESILAVRGALTTVPTEELRRMVAIRRQSMNPVDAFMLEAASAERPLILKHALAIGMVDSKQYKIWANEYRPNAWQKAGGGARHVERYHNHRFHIGSIMLRGGYTADEFVYPEGQMPDGSMTDGTADTWGAGCQGLAARTRMYREGDIMSLHSDEIHRLRDIQPGTVSLIVEMPRVRDFGIVFDETATDPAIVFPDMGGNYDRLGEQFLSSDVTRAT